MAADPLDFLFGLERLGMKFGLENITRLCAALGHPERTFPSLIVAGTNGKGSVTAMVETVLRQAGYRSARYTSPHLIRLEERYVLNGAEVETSTLRAAAGRVQRAVESLLAAGDRASPPTFFECATAIAFDLFRSARVDVAVLEVGLGGRLDATNVVTPLAAAITSIDFDHQALLGNTLASIAREKAGVIKQGIPVVVGPLPQDADDVVRRVCTEQGARMIHAVVESVAGMDLGLRGRHQVENAAVAMALLGAVAERFPVTPKQLRDGLAQTSWPARLEMFSTGPAHVLLDAAHNPAGARALALYLADIGWAGVTLVFGAMRDKDVAGMLGPLLPSCRTVVCATAPTPRAVPAHELAALVATLAPIRVEAIADPAAALAHASAGSDRVVAAGSIFLIGPLRDILRGFRP